MRKKLIAVFMTASMIVASTAMTYADISPTKDNIEKGQENSQEAAAEVNNLSDADVTISDDVADMSASDAKSSLANELIEMGKNLSLGSETSAEELQKLNDANEILKEDDAKVSLEVNQGTPQASAQNQSFNNPTAAGRYISVVAEFKITSEKAKNAGKKGEVSISYRNKITVNLGGKTRAQWASELGSSTGNIVVIAFSSGGKWVNGKWSKRSDVVSMNANGYVTLPHLSEIGVFAGSVNDYATSGGNSISSSGGGGGGGGSSTGSSAVGSITGVNSSITTRVNTPGNWVQGADGGWTFVNAGVPYLGWIVSGNQWYYIGANGRMATGWVLIDGKYYYFSSVSVAGQPMGSLYMAKTTPDGYNVDSNGVWG